MANIGNSICCFHCFPVDMSNSPRKKGAERSLVILNDVNDLPRGDQMPLKELITMKLSPSMWRWVIAFRIASQTPSWRVVASATETEDLPRFKAAVLTRLASKSLMIKPAAAEELRTEPLKLSFDGGSKATKIEEGYLGVEEWREKSGKNILKTVKSQK